MSSPVTATFVFTDLVDSTATAARLGPDAADALRQTHFRLLRGAAAASGGTEVKNLGDGLMLVYSSPSRALAGAVGMQQAIEHHNRSGGDILAVRIGVSTGEAVEEEGDYFGEPVIEAARLCAAARGGQILAANLVRLLVGHHATQTFVDVGELALKGLAGPVATVEVHWEPVIAAGMMPLPARLVGAASDALFGFFGRASEVAAVEDARKHAQGNGRPQLVFVAGEAGIGKTALVAQAARGAHSDGTIVLFGHSDEDLGVAYQPWIEAMTALVRDGDAAWIENLPPAQRAALARLLPDIGDNGTRVGDRDIERLLLLEAIIALFAAVSQHAPVLLVLDDLHWADTATLQVLRHVTSSTTGMDLTIACTYRDSDLRRGDPLTHLLADLHREANVTRLQLAGLQDDDLIDLMAAAAGHDLDDRGVALAHALRRETDGNPFFTGEMLRHLSESSAIALGENGRWTVDGNLDALGLPRSVRDVVGRRVERLGEEARRVLCLAAVIGREFDLDVIAPLADSAEDEVLDLLEAAVTAAVVVESDVAGRYRFAHALIQHALYDELSATRRQRAHQRVAELLERTAPDDDAAALADLARHWVAATRPADLDKALEYVRRAGDAARNDLAPDDAIRWYEQALELLDRQRAPDPRTRAELLIALGRAQRSAGRPDFRASLFEAAAIAERIDDAALLADAALGFVAFTGTLWGDSDANRLVATALERTPIEPTAKRARLLAALAETFDAATQSNELRSAALDAVETARRAGDAATLVDVVDSAYSLLETPDRVDAAIRDLNEAVDVADRVGDPVLRAKARYRAIWGAYQRADLERADRLVHEVEVLADRIGLPAVGYEAALLRTGRHLLAGDVDAAHASNERVLEFATAAGTPEALAVYGGIMHSIFQHRGREGEIVEFFLDIARDNPSLTALRSTIPAMLCVIGRIDEARERIEVELADGFDYPYDSLWVVSMVNVLDAAVSTRHVVAAQRLVERLEPYPDHVVNPMGPVVLGTVARPLGRAGALLGDYERAETWFATARAIDTRLGAPFWTARDELDHADLCLTRRADGDLEHARTLATTASSTAAQFGCEGLAERAQAILGETA